MPETLIKVDNLSKKFCHDLKTSLWYGLKDLGGEIFGRSKTGHNELREQEFWAIKDLSFEVKRGECLGLIGRNGAGKSTLLRMLNGLIKPDMGRIEMHGKINALIALNAGFNPILTGRENIYINASVRGLSKKETDQKLDAIIDFSELKDFIDSPVQYYSSGMRMRLGFSIAAELEPDILLIDEVLAVGDLGFVLKCFNKMDKLMPKTAMIFVSHNMPMISRMCTKLLVLKNGISVYQMDDIPHGISCYYDQFDISPEKFINTDVAMLESIKFGIDYPNENYTELFEAEQGNDLMIFIKIRLFRPIYYPKIMISFLDKEQRAFGEVLNFQEQIKIDKIENSINVSVHFKNIEFSQGIYSISLTLLEAKDKNRNYILRIQSAAYFKVISKNPGWAPMHFTPSWELHSN